MNSAPNIENLHKNINYLDIIRACTLSVPVSDLEMKKTQCLLILKSYFSKKHQELDPNTYLPDNKGQEKWTPLLACCWMGFTEGVNFLLEQGADPNVPAKDGKSALSFSVSKNKISIIQKLIQKGANINYIDNHGKTALMDACEKGNLEAVKILLHNEADTQIKNKDFKTCMDYCQDNVIKSHIEHFYFSKILKVKEGTDTRRTKI